MQAVVGTGEARPLLATCNLRVPVSVVRPRVGLVLGVGPAVR